MNDDILKRLDPRVNRRGFLRGSGWAAVAIIGAAVLPLSAAQQPQESKKDDTKDGKAPEGKEGKDGKKSDAPNPPPTDPEFLVTKTGQDGRQFRECPVCGYNMYKQNRTWTCENCGYTYDE